LAAAVVGAMLAAFTTALIWTSVTAEMSACRFGPRTPPGEMLPLLSLVGVVLGASWAASALVACSQVRSGRAWRGAVMGIGTLVALTFVMISVATFQLMLVTGCNRPGVT
jgi:hypothetical protein